jgi:hypothetical protein
MSKAAELANLIGNINAGGGGVNRNVIINGAMNCSQRSTSETGLGATAGYYTVDRFQIAVGGTATAGRLTMTQDSSAPEGFANSVKLDCTTADTSIAAGETLRLVSVLEGQNLQTFKKGTSNANPWALSFYVKGNASATYVVELYDLDNVRHVAKTFNVTTDWTRVELSFPADTTGSLDDDIAGSLQVTWWLHSGTDFNSGTLPATWASVTNANRAGGLSTSFYDSTDRTFFLTGVQLEVGQNPTSFEHEPFERTLAKARRYFQRHDNANSAYRWFGAGYTTSTTSGWFGVVLDPIMRVTPSLTTTDVTKFLVDIYSGGLATSALSLNFSSQKLARISPTVSGATAGDPAFLASNGDSELRALYFDSEL